MMKLMEVSSCNSNKQNRKKIRYSKHFWIFWAFLKGKKFHEIPTSWSTNPFLLSSPSVLAFLGNQTSVPPDCCVEVLKSHVARWSVSPSAGRLNHRKWELRNPQIPLVSSKNNKHFQEFFGGLQFWDKPKSQPPHLKCWVLCQFCKIPNTKSLKWSKTYGN